MAKASFELDLAAFRDRLAKIESRIAEVAGNRSCPQIVVVSKYLSADDCSTLRGEDFGPLGENRAQDLEQKVGIAEDQEGWHFIGHLQRNKVATVIPRVSCLHSLDSDRLARQIDRFLEERGSPPLDVLVQVNVSGESSKGGLAPFEATEQVLAWTEQLQNLRITGLMTMAPIGDLDTSRLVFQALRELKERIRESLPAEAADHFNELSMGMSNDFEVAVEEGATLLRLGRILYSGEAG